MWAECPGIVRRILQAPLLDFGHQLRLHLSIEDARFRVRRVARKLSPTSAGLMSYQPSGNENSLDDLTHLGCPYVFERLLPPAHEVASELFQSTLRMLLAVWSLRSDSYANDRTARRNAQD